MVLSFRCRNSDCSCYFLFFLAIITVIEWSRFADFKHPFIAHPPCEINNIKRFSTTSSTFFSQLIYDFEVFTKCLLEFTL